MAVCHDPGVTPYSPYNSLRRFAPHLHAGAAAGQGCLSLRPLRSEAVGQFRQRTHFDVGG